MSGVLRCNARSVRTSWRSPCDWPPPGIAVSSKPNPFLNETRSLAFVGTRPLRGATRAAIVYRRFRGGSQNAERGIRLLWYLLVQFGGIKASTATLRTKLIKSHIVILEMW